MGMMLGALVLGVIFVIVGGIALAIGIVQYRDGEDTKSWTATTAQVTSTDIEQKTDTRRDSDGTRRTSTTYTPIVHYEYTVDGTTYDGDRIKIGLGAGSEGSARDIVERYPAGAEVTAYYDPGNPGSAVLEQGADRTGTYLFGGIGGLFTLIGLGALAGAGIFYRKTIRPAF
jgi:hypothetical protein